MYLFNWDQYNLNEHWGLLGKQNAHLAARKFIFNKTACFLEA